MSRNMANQFEPNYAVPPGATLLETIEVLGMSQSELAQRMGRPTKTVNEIINGKAAITPETALQLEKVVGIPASFWNTAERHYREILARQENIMLHGKKETFLEFDGQKDPKEEVANAFARDFLIPPAAYSQFVTAQGASFSAAAIVEFARKIGVSPGIVVGRLQKDGRIPWSMHNRLKLGLRLVATGES